MKVIQQTLCEKNYGRGQCMCFCLYLWLRASMVLLLGQVLPALGLSTGYEVSNSHWKKV